MHTSPACRALALSLAISACTATSAEPETSTSESAQSLKDAAELERLIRIRAAPIAPIVVGYDYVAKAWPLAYKVEHADLLTDAAAWLRRYGPPEMYDWPTYRDPSLLHLAGSLTRTSDDLAIALYRATATDSVDLFLRTVLQHRAATARAARAQALLQAAQRGPMSEITEAVIAEEFGYILQELSGFGFPVGNHENMPTTTEIATILKRLAPALAQQVTQSASLLHLQLGTLMEEFHVGAGDGPIFDLLAREAHFSLPEVAL